MEQTFNLGSSQKNYLVGEGIDKPVQVDGIKIYAVSKNPDTVASWVENSASLIVRTGKENYIPMFFDRVITEPSYPHDSRLAILKDLGHVSMLKSTSDSYREKVKQKLKTLLQREPEIQIRDSAKEILENLTSGKLTEDDVF